MASGLEARVRALEEQPPPDAIGPTNVFISPAGEAEALTHGLEEQVAALEEAQTGDEESLEALDERTTAIEEGEVGPVYLRSIICGKSDLASAGANRETLQEAIELVEPRGGTIWLPGCDIYFDGTIDLVESRDIAFQGRGGLTPGAPSATRLIHVGLIGPPASPWECESSFGIVFRDLQLLHTSDLSGTHLVNFEHGGVREEDSAYNHFERCNLEGLGNNSAFSLLNLDQAISCTMEKVHFGPAKTHVRGMTGSENYSNAHSFHDCTFGGATVMPVMDPGEGWTFLNPTVEPLATGAAGFISENADVENVAKGLAIVGGWFGDADGTGDWIRFSGTGFASYGSRVGTGGSWMRLGEKGAVEGLAIVGGHFDSVTNLLVVAGGTYAKSHAAWMVAGNHYVNTGPISFAAGTILPERSIIDNPKDHLYMPGMLFIHHGAVSDSVFPVPPPDGTMAYDNESAYLWIRSGEKWRHSAAFTE